jgi:hypothetical protein
MGRAKLSMISFECIKKIPLGASSHHENCAYKATKVFVHN